MKKGMPAQILPELPNAVKLDTKVVLVDKIIDAASNTFRVRLALPNPGNKLPAGARCRVELPDADGVADAAATAVKPAAYTPGVRRIDG